MIYRNQYETDFTIISNTLANDSSISFEARGVLMYLLSKPPDWEVRHADLVKASSAGKAKIARIVGELINAGYMTRIQTRSEDGTFSTQSINVYGEPQEVDQPQTDYRETVNPLPVNRTLQSNKKKQNTKGTKNVSTPTPSKFEPLDCIPESLNQPEFIEAWSDWVQHRKEIKKKMTPKATSSQLRTLETIGIHRAITAINHSISNGYQGIYEPKQTANGQHKQPAKAPQYVPDERGRF